MRTTRVGRATDIPQAVKRAVWERDNHRCIICGHANAAPNAHFISRAHLGRGIEENIVTLCTLFGNGCHHRFDNGSRVERELMREEIRKYLKSKYPDWDEDKLVYRRD